MADETPQFEGLNLVARDVDATIAFYRLFGVELPDDKIWRTSSGPHHTEGVPVGPGAEIEIDSEALAAEYNTGFDPSSRTMLVFRVETRDAVDRLHDRLTDAGHASSQPPTAAFWGARFAVVKDPDGRDIGIMSPSDAAFRTSPPDL
jgi:uncharacterized glyoxalase superfamily protein PhnB